MSKHLTGVMAVALAAAMLFTVPALAHHRPGNVVVIGGTVSLTGYNPYVVRSGRMLNGYKLLVDELNARGGLLSHKVELKVYDDKTNRRTAIELYERLITEDVVDLFLGPYSSALGEAVANVMERYRRPFVIQGAARQTIWQRGRKYVFSGPQTYARYRFKGVLHAAKLIGVERIAVITRPGTTNLYVFMGAQEWAKKLGLKVVLSEGYPLEETNFRALLRRIEATGADAIISQADFSGTVAQVRQLRELDINVKMFAAYGGAVTQPRFIKELGSLAEYVVGHSTWEPKPVLGYLGMAEFIENYEKRFGVKPNYHASEGYATMQIIEAAVKYAGSFDPEKVRNALTSISVQTVRSTYKANEQGMSSMDPLAIQIQNGKRVIVWPPHKSEAKVVPMPKWEDRGKK